MAEQLYTIPVNDAFQSDCECPLCNMQKQLEQNAVDYTMGPSYMEDDNRALTDKMGFCSHHIRILYGEKNRLGLALMQNTHMNKTISDLKKLAASKPSAKGGLFKKSDASPVGEYINTLNNTCFICERINKTFERYIDTIFHLWKKDASFRESFRASKGFCVKHYGILYDSGLQRLSKEAGADFLNCLNDVFFNNIERVNADVSWFIDKYDYRNKDASWKNSKDAIPRSIIKTNSQILD